MHFARGAEHLDHDLLRGHDGLADELCIGLERSRGLDAERGLGQDAAVAADGGPHRQRELAPPDHVGEVAERADHRDARALFGVGELVSADRYLDVEQGRADHGAEQRLVTRIVGMGHERHA